MIRGDLVHIPQGTLLLQNKDNSLFESEGGYIKAEKPVRALFWDKDPKKPSWGSTVIFPRETVFLKQKCEARSPVCFGFHRQNGKKFHRQTRYHADA